MEIEKEMDELKEFILEDSHIKRESQEQVRKIEPKESVTPLGRFLIDKCPWCENLIDSTKHLVEYEKLVRRDEREKTLRNIIFLIQLKTSRRKWTSKEANYVTEYRQTIYKKLMKMLEEVSGKR